VARADRESVPGTRFGDALRAKARSLQRETMALYYAGRDPRTPLAARLITILVVAYALSPIDLIPDFIPVLGLLDDLILIPLGIALALRLIPAEAMAEGRARADAALAQPKSYAAATVIVLLWLAAVILLSTWAYRAFATS
jgi:uncharacterized membrane protein YkvA (DUF1232 family)